MKLNSFLLCMLLVAWLLRFLGISGGKQILRNTIKFDVRIIMINNKYSFLCLTYLLDKSALECKLERSSQPQPHSPHMCLSRAQWMVRDQGY